MAYNVLTLCLMLTLTVTLTDSVELYPPKPMRTLTIYDWSFTDEETTGKMRNNFKMDIVKCFTKSLHENINTRVLEILQPALCKSFQCFVILRIYFPSATAAAER